MTQSLVGALAVVAILSTTARAQLFPPTATLQADRDATLYEDASGNIANGSGTGIFVGVTGQPSIRRALVRFDVAGSIPAGSKILGVGLRAISTQSSSPSPLATTLHRVLADWSEGGSIAPGNGGSGAVAQAGDTTWLHRNYPSTLWAQAGGDFDAMVPLALVLKRAAIVNAPSPNENESPGLRA